MWYKFAAYGTIDLQKYIGEKEGEDFDFESELQTLLQSGVSPNFGVIYLMWFMNLASFLNNFPIVRK